MMKNYILISFLILSLTTFGQKISSDFDITLSEPYEVVDAKFKQYTPVGDDAVIMTKASPEVITLQRFDANSMKEVARNSYEDLPKYHKPQRIIETSSGMFYLYEAYNKKEKTFSFYSREYDVEKASFVSNDKVFTTSRPAINLLTNAHGATPILSNSPMAIRLNTAGVKFRITQSFDKSRVLVQYRLKPLVKKDKENYDVIGFQVFDQDMKLLSSQEVQMPYTEAEINNLAYAVGKDGTSYMLVYLNEAKKFEMFVIDSDGGLDQINLNIDGDLVFEKFEIIEDKQGNIRCAGLYANGYDLKISWKGDGMLSFNADGLLTFGIDADGSVSHVSKIEFPKELLALYLTDKQREKLEKREAEGKAGVEDLKLIGFNQQEDGSSILVCEQQYMRSESITNDAMTYRFTNLFVVKLADDGELDWIKKLPKNQYGQPDDYSGLYFIGQMSTKYMSNDGEHYLMFVDNPKNEDLPMTSRPEGHKNNSGGFLSAFVLSDADGSVERHTLIDMEDIKGKKAYQFDVTRICQVGPGTYVMEVYLKGKEDGMVKIQLK